MKQTELQVVESQPLPPRLHLLRTRSPELAGGFAPGQFLMVRDARAGCDDLRVPLFPTRLQGDSIAFVFEPRGRLAPLAQISLSTALSALGPVGHAFQLSPRTLNLLLVGEEDAALRLLPLADAALDRGASVMMIVWSPLSRKGLLAREWVPSDVEITACVGESVLKSELAQPLLWAEQVCAAGSRELYGLLRAAVDRQPARRGPAYTQALWTPEYLCGFGLCGRCGAISGHAGTACQVGPAVDLKDVT